MGRNDVQAIMYQKGKIEVDNFEVMISQFFSNKYYFRMLPVEYIVYDENYVIYDANKHCLINQSHYRKVISYYNFLLRNDIKLDNSFILKIPGLINLKDIESKIALYSPVGLRLLSDKEIEYILSTQGYKNPYFDRVYNKNNNCLFYQLYAEPIVVGNEIEGIIEEKLSPNFLKFGIKENILLDKGIIDLTVFPRVIPSITVRQELNKLAFNSNFIPNYVRYVREISTNSFYITDYLPEYKLHNKRFVLYEFQLGINNGFLYWLEVTPNNEEVKSLKRNL